MESLNPFWWGVGLLSAWVAGLGLATTLVAGVLWLIWRSKVSLILFLALLIIAVLAGVTFLVSLALMELRA